MRRELVTGLEIEEIVKASGETQGARTSVSFRDLMPVASKSDAAPELSVLCRTIEQVQAAIDSDVGIVY